MATKKRTPKYRMLVEGVEDHARAVEQALDAGDCMAAYSEVLAGEFKSGKLDSLKLTESQRGDSIAAQGELAYVQETFIQKCMRQYTPTRMELVEERRPYAVSRVTDRNPSLFPIKPNDFINGLVEQRQNGPSGGAYIQFDDVLIENYNTREKSRTYLSIFAYPTYVLFGGGINGGMTNSLKPLQSLAAGKLTLMPDGPYKVKLNKDDAASLKVWMDEAMEHGRLNF